LLAQLVAKGLVQFSHLDADTLDRHVQPPGEATFLCNGPEAEKMAIVEHVNITSLKPMIL
jgi:hypothetical protein